MNRPIVAIGAPADVPLGAHRADPTVDSVVEAAQAVHGDVLLATRDDESRRVARAVRLALGADRVGILHTPLTFTAWAMVIRLLATMPPDVELSRAGEVVTAVGDALATRVVLNSVASLEAPAPTFGQHVRSIAPGALFDVDLSAGTVGRFTGSLRVQSPLVVVARSAKPLSAQIELPDARIELGTVDAGWKAARWLEVTLLDESRWAAATAALRVATASGARCPACGRSTATTCLFCEIPPAGAHVPADAVPVGGLPR